MTDLVNETFDGFCPWHPERGFDIRGYAKEPRQLGDSFRNIGYRVVPVSVTITATGTGLARAATLHPATTGI